MESKTTKESQVSVFAGAFTPVLAKHTKHLSPVDILAVGIDRMLRNFEPMRRQVEAWRASQLSDEAAKLRASYAPGAEKLGSLDFVPRGAPHFDPLSTGCKPPETSLTPGNHPAGEANEQRSVARRKW